MSILLFFLFFQNVVKADLFDFPLFSDVKESSLSSTLSNETTLKIINDQDNLVLEQFKIPQYLHNRVKFWFDIYTKYDNNSVVFHDRFNPELVYYVLDLSSVKSLNNPFLEENITKSLIAEKHNALKKSLENLSKNKNDELTKQIISAIEKSNIQLPKQTYQRQSFYRGLLKNLRYQRGQKNQIEKSIQTYLPYQPYLEFLADHFQLPHEVILISFLESSFNLSVKSKAGAVGVWQIMPNISNKFFPAHSTDYRLNPILSAYPAFYLLKENKNQLKNWDLAISAYNSGYKHILKAKKNLKLKKISLEDLVKNYKNKDFGFASVNYYSEFLALVYAFTYKNQIYESHKYKSQVNLNDLFIHLSVCKNTLPDDLLPINNHLRSNQLEHGTIIVSSYKLNPKNFHLVDSKEFTKRPIHWKIPRCL